MSELPQERSRFQVELIRIRFPTTPPNLSLLTIASHLNVRLLLLLAPTFTLYCLSRSSITLSVGAPTRSAPVASAAKARLSQRFPRRSVRRGSDCQSPAASAVCAGTASEANAYGLRRLTRS